DPSNPRMPRQVRQAPKAHHARGLAPGDGMSSNAEGLDGREIPVELQSNADGVIRGSTLRPSLVGAQRPQEIRVHLPEVQRICHAVPFHRSQLLPRVPNMLPPIVSL